MDISYKYAMPLALKNPKFGNFQASRGVARFGIYGATFSVTP